MERSYERTVVDTSGEDNLVIGLIVNDDFCRRVLPMLTDPGVLAVRQNRRIVQWVREYHVRYDKAPGDNIQGIFEAERKRLSEDEAGLIESFLSGLSDRHEKEQVQNWDYRVDQARDYIRSRALRNLAKATTALCDWGDLGNAEVMVYDFLAAEVATSQWAFPLVDTELQQRVLERVDTGLFKLDGVLGELFGWWQRGWLVSFFGAYKRGKSWWLMETAVQGVVQGLRVAFISLEMDEVAMSKRFLTNVTALPDFKGMVKMPIWDCKDNQTGTCNLSERTNALKVPRTGDDEDVYFDPKSDYRACTYCKISKSHFRNYKVATYFREVRKREHFKDVVMERVKVFAQQYRGGNLALMVYPRFSAGLDQVKVDIDRLEVLHKFAPDMVVIDYANILYDGGTGEEWLRLDRLWMELSKMAGERKVLVVTASQATTKGLDMKTMGGAQVAGTRRILGHIDLGISLNQFGDEREAMVMRLAPVQGARHGATPDGEVFVLQNLSLGQPYMDSFAPKARMRLLGLKD